MSAVPRQPGGGYSRLRMTADEYLALGETEEHYELVEGVVQMSPTPSPRHQKVLRLLQRQLEAFIDSNPGFDYYPDISVRLSPQHVFEPDLSCFAPGRLDVHVDRIAVPPDLIIEILSPNNRAYDLTQKRSFYERFGVGEYWTVDPTDGRVRCFRRIGGKLEEVEVSGHRLESKALAGFVLDLRPLRPMPHKG